MNLLQLNNILEGNYEAEVPMDGDSHKRITEADFNHFRELLVIDDAFTQGLQYTNSYKEYFDAYELLNKVVNPDLKEDLFYSAKLGFFYQGVPSRLTYLLHLALRKYHVPNYAINAIDIRYLARFLKRDELVGEVTIKQVIENLLGKSYLSLSKHRRCVKYGDIFEIYVENMDRVLILPEELEEITKSQEDLLSVEFVGNLGVCIRGIPIRTFAGKIGFTRNEYDLRGCK